MTRPVASLTGRRDRLRAVGGSGSAPAPVWNDLAVPNCEDAVELLSVEVAYLAGLRAVGHVVQPSLANFLR